MKVRKYYIFSRIPEQTGYREETGTLILKRKRVIAPISQLNITKFPNNAVPQAFKYELATSRFIANQIDLKGNQIDIQRKILIIEIDNKEGRSIHLLHEEYMIDKTWWNMQRLAWMFGEHWIQKDFRFWLPFIISILSLAIAFGAFRSSSMSGEINEINTVKLDSLRTVQSKLSVRVKKLESSDYINNQQDTGGPHKTKKKPNKDQ